MIRQNIRDNKESLVEGVQNNAVGLPGINEAFNGEDLEEIRNRYSNVGQGTNNPTESTFGNLVDTSTKEDRIANYKKVLELRKSLGIEVAEGTTFRYVDEFAKVRKGRFGTMTLTCDGPCVISEEDIINEVEGETLGNYDPELKLITLYRGAITSGSIEETMYIDPSSGNFISRIMSRPMSAIETGIWVLGHEAAHSRGVDPVPGLNQHMNAEFHGYQAFKSYRRSQHD